MSDISDLILRQYQKDALNLVRQQFKDGKKRPLLYSPTGSGKTECAFEMIRGARRKQTGALFIANRIELVGQASRRLYRAGIEHGIIQGQNTKRVYEPVLVGSIQTIAKRGLPDHVGIIIVDEAHACAGSQAYVELFKRTAGIPIIGLSATPFSKGLGKFYPELNGPLFETIVPAATISELIEWGYLVDCDIWAPSEPDLDNVKIEAGEYNQKQLGEAVDKAPLIGDIVEHWKKLGGDKQTVCFATNIAHSKHIVDQFNAQGIPADHIDCFTTEEDRRSILGRLDKGDLRVVSNVAVLAEGWDCPVVEVMICARPTRSLIRWIQMSGRILRPFPGKGKAIILDHSGTAKRLGFPTDDLPLELDDGKPKKSSSSEPREKLPKPCPNCTYLKPAGVHKCPACGFAPQKQNDIEHADGELGLLKKKRYSMDEKQVFWGELLSYAAAYGYQRGWCSHKYRARFGVWPVGLSDIRREISTATANWIKYENIKWAKSRKQEEQRA